MTHLSTIVIRPTIPNLYINIKSPEVKVLVLKLPVFLPEELISVKVWNGKLHSRFQKKFQNMFINHPEFE